MTEFQLTDFELAVLIGVVLVGVVVLVVIARRAQPARPGPTSSAAPADLGAMQTEMEFVKGKLKDLDHDFKQLRTMMNAMPTKDSVYEIGLQVAELKGDIKLNNTQTNATARAVERIEDWLMHRTDQKATGA